jgi:hypothetical protein
LADFVHGILMMNKEDLVAYFLCWNIDQAVEAELLGFSNQSTYRYLFGLIGFVSQ